MRGSFLIALVALALAVVGCNGKQPKPPPQVNPAPRELTALRIHVYNASSDAARKAEEDDVSGYTIHLRGAVQRALVRAGYTVVIKPEEPHDLVARIHAEWPWKKPGTATLVLEAREGVVTQFSGLVDIDENADLDEQDAADLVDAISRSPSVIAFARRKARSGAQQIAVPAN
jgi:hypothetical protein